VSFIYIYPQIYIFLRLNPDYRYSIFILIFKIFMIYCTIFRFKNYDFINAAFEKCGLKSITVASFLKTRLWKNLFSLHKFSHFVRFFSVPLYPMNFVHIAVSPSNHHCTAQLRLRLRAQPPSPSTCQTSAPLPLSFVPPCQHHRASPSLHQRWSSWIVNKG